MQAAHYGAYRNVEHVGDFFVVKPLHISQQNRQPERLGQRIHRCLHLGISEGFQRNVFGGAVGLHRFKAAYPPVKEQVFNFFIEVGLRRFATLGAVSVDVGVGEDAKQPGPKVGALFKALETLVGLEVRLLHEVFGIGVVVGHAHGRGIKRRQMLHGNICEVLLRRHGATIGCLAVALEQLPENNPENSPDFPDGGPGKNAFSAATLASKPVLRPGLRPGLGPASIEAVGDCLFLLRGHRSSLVIDTSRGSGVIVHWGIGLSAAEAVGLTALKNRPIPNGSFDDEDPLEVVPTRSGYIGMRPGLEGRRADGSGWAPKFGETTHAADVSTQATTGKVGLTVAAMDSTNQLALATEFVLDGFDVLTVRTTLTNTAPSSSSQGEAPGTHSHFALHRLQVCLPLSSTTDEVLDFPGRWVKEGQPQRRRLGIGALSWDNRRGRHSHQNSPGLFAGTPNFTERSGELVGIHIAWSGAHEMRVERGIDGRVCLQAGVLLDAGEVDLAPGESFTTPWVMATWSGEGLSAASSSFHSWFRARPQHPRTPRPILLNTWEAVYFDHNLETLCALADSAAAVGIERYVLDDGWFGSRRHDRAGLGDWWVSTDAHPLGLTPLISHVRKLGMEFGLWFEPEMVNPDSDLYRAHPDWVLSTPGVDQPLARTQYILDLTNPAVSAYLFERIDAVLSEHEIGYVKWDYNRDMCAPGHEGRASSYRQTQALYSLLRKIRSAHPGVEIETRACIDALERQQIQRSFSMFFPPELMGAHVGGSPAHTTGRRATVNFRAATALFGHLGFEWDLTRASEADRAVAANIVRVHKKFRMLLHSGVSVRVDYPVASGQIYGVISEDASEALFAYAQLTTNDTSVPSSVTFSGLDPKRTYEVSLVHLEEPPAWGTQRQLPGWLGDHSGVGKAKATGVVLGALGLALPVCHPESVLLFHLTAV
jgi:alpha-galactosidase